MWSFSLNVTLIDILTLRLMLESWETDNKGLEDLFLYKSF